MSNKREDSDSMVQDEEDEYQGIVAESDKYKKKIDQHKKPKKIPESEFYVEQNVLTKKWTVSLNAKFAGKNKKKWIVEFNSKNDANDFKRDLEDARVKSPFEEPEKYGTPRTHTDGVTMIYVKS